MQLLFGAETLVRVRLCTALLPVVGVWSTFQGAVALVVKNIFDATELTALPLKAKGARHAKPLKLLMNTVNELTFFNEWMLINQK